MGEDEPNEGNALAADLLVWIIDQRQFYGIVDVDQAPPLEWEVEIEDRVDAVRARMESIFANDEVREVFELHRGVTDELMQRQTQVIKQQARDEMLTEFGKKILELHPLPDDDELDDSDGFDE